MGLLAALQFLTVIPVKRSFSAEQIGRSTSYFPVVGIIIGVILAVLNYLLGLVLPASVVNVLLVVSMVLLSGALHLDGLVDTCDGIAGHRTPEERWRVMHDSRAGGFGVIGAALFLLVKFVSLNSVPQSLMMFTLVAAPVISRWTMVYAIFAYPYARPSGLGKMFTKAVSTPGGALATGAAIPLGLGAGYYGLWRPHVNKGPFEREAQALRDAVDYGFLNEDEAAIATTQLRKRYADKHLAGTGYSSKGPGGYYNYGWNQSS